MSGSAFIHECFSIVQTNGEALELLPDKGLFCVQFSEEVAVRAFREEGFSVCQSCPEFCTFGLLVYALTTPILPYDGDLSGLYDCSQSVLVMVKAHEHLRNLSTTACCNITFSLVNELVIKRRQLCGELRSKERQLTLPIGLPPSPPGKEDVSVLVLIVATADTLANIQFSIQLWRCYCEFHGLDFYVDTNDYHVTHRFKHPNWLKWHRAKEFMDSEHFRWDWLILVDPDMIVSPSCYFQSLKTFLFPKFRNFDILTKETFSSQTLNNGLTGIRNSEVGKAFLIALTFKDSWMQSLHHDQGPFDETVLEFLAMEAPEHNYASECVQFLFPQCNGDHSVSAYSFCWWGWAERLGGPPGSRTSKVIGFVDAGEVDVNYVVGVKGLNETAFIYHFAGNNKDWSDIQKFASIDTDSWHSCRKILENRQRLADSQKCVVGNSQPRVVCQWPLTVC